MLWFRRHVEQTDAIQEPYKRGFGGKAPSCWAMFAISLKKHHFNVIWITFWSFFMAIGKNKAAEIKNSFEILKLPSPFSPLYLKTKFKPRFNIRICEQARSQKFAVGGCFGGLGAEPPSAGDHWRSGSEAPSRWRLVIWGQNLQPPEARGLGRSPQRSTILHFFAKIT